MIVSTQWMIFCMCLLKLCFVQSMINLQNNIDLSFVVVVLHHIVVIMVQYFYVVIVFIREYKLYLLQDHISEFDAKLPA
jgi:hypothetical protein